jgi:hypothetical protein
VHLVSTTDYPGGSVAAHDLAFSIIELGFEELGERLAN